MRLPRTWKIRLTVGLSFLLTACAGTPPKLERPIKLYTGTPSRIAICRLTKAQVAGFAKSVAQHQRTKAYADKVVNAALVRDALECIAADSAKFSEFVGIHADDLRVLLQYQENLLYSCERWKQ